MIYYVCTVNMCVCVCVKCVQDNPETTFFFFSNMTTCSNRSHSTRDLEEHQDHNIGWCIQNTFLQTFVAQWIYNTVKLESCGVIANTNA